MSAILQTEKEAEQERILGNPVKNKPVPGKMIICPEKEHTIIHLVIIQNLQVLFPKTHQLERASITNTHMNITQLHGKMENASEWRRINHE